MDNHARLERFVMYLSTPPLLEYFDYERHRTIRFKSKHEWEWAHYFQNQGYDWEYEPLTYFSEFKCTRDRRLTYTPDFGLVRNTISVEIKTYREKHVRNRLDFCLQPLILIFGMPSPLKHDIHVHFPNTQISHRCINWTAAYDLARNGIPSWIKKAS